ncbi:MAG: hypothetical protein K9N48_03950 [Verrucomicrobia bacterium]|nr:hypothetical protein [Verrucomicrobiota bacterium]MCF7708712.1 hypothetical protein [Verrucomicrobiota bacterium]
MEFLKNHYEKIILSAVLLGLAIAASMLPFKLNAMKEELDSYFTPPPPPKEVQPLELVEVSNVLNKLENPPEYELAGVHNLFNPVEWKRTPDGRLIKVETGSEIGPKALDVVDIRPLTFKIEYTGTDKVRDRIEYQFTVLNEANPNSYLRRELSRSVSLGQKNDFFILRNVVGEPENPTKFVVELVESGEKVEILPGEPFVKVAGHAADLKYGPENKTFDDMRVGSRLSFGDDSYIIVAITEKDVTVSSVSTTKRTTVNYNAAS